MARNIFQTIVVFNRLLVVQPMVNREMNRVIRIGLAKMREDVAGMLEHAGTGRIYAVPGTGGRQHHRASRPGAPPARLFGSLANSIDWKASGLSGSLYSSSEYAPHLEFGTVHMAPRPFMRPTARRWKPILDAMAAEAVRDVARRLGR